MHQKGCSLVGPWWIMMVSCYTGDAMNDAMNEWMDKQRFLKKIYNQLFFKETKEASLIMSSIYSNTRAHMNVIGSPVGGGGREGGSLVQPQSSHRLHTSFHWKQRSSPSFLNTLPRSCDFCQRCVIVARWGQVWHQLGLFLLLYARLYRRCSRTCEKYATPPTPWQSIIR